MNEAVLPLTTQESRTTNPWVVWAIAAMFAFYQFMLQSSASILAGGLNRDFHLSSFSIGLFSATYVVAYMVLQIPCGILIDRYGPRKLLLISVPLTGLCCLLLALAPNPATAFTARLLMGIASAPAVVSTLYLAVNWFSPKLYALVVGITELVCLSGGGLGQKLLSEVTEGYGWRMAMGLSAAIAIILLALIWRFVHDGPNHILPDEPAPESTVSFLSRLSAIFSSREIVATGLFTGLSGVLLGAFSSLWGIPYLQTTYNLSLSDAATGTALVFVGTGLSSVLLGYCSDKLGRRKPIMLFSTVASVVLLCTALYIDLSLSTMLALLFAVGLVSGGYMLGFSVAKELLPRYCQGTGIGFINMMTLAIGGPILQPAVGGLLQIQGAGHLDRLTAHDYEVALGIIPVVIALSLLCLPFIRETFCKPVHQAVLQKGRTRSTGKTTPRFWRLRYSQARKSVGE